MDKEKIGTGNMIVPYFEDTNKKHPVLRAVITCLVILLIAGSVFYALNRQAVNEFFKRTFSSPKDYFASVERRDLSGKADAIVRSVSGLASALNDEGSEGSAELRITANEMAKSLVSAALDVDLSTFDSAELKCSAVRERDDLLINALLFLNDVQIGSGDVSLSLRTKELLISSPEISDWPASVDLSDKLTFISPVLPVAASLAARLDTETLNGLTEKYLDSVLSEFGSFSKKGGTLEMSGVRQKCTVLTAEATRSEMYRALASLLRKLKDDETTASLVRSFLDEYVMEYSLTAEKDGTPITGEELYGVFLTKIDEFTADCVKEAEKYPDDKEKVFRLTDYVDKHGNIIGREIGYEEKTLLSVGFAEHRTDFGFEARYNGALISDGNGTTRNGALSGSFKIYDGNGSALLTADVTELDRDGLKSGTINGEFLLSPTERLYSMLPFDTSSLPSLITNNVSLKIGVYSDNDKIRVELTPLLGGAEFVKITAVMTETPWEKPRMIDGDGSVIIESFEDLAEWFEGVDAVALGGKLAEAGLPEELIDTIMQTAGW